MPVYNGEGYLEQAIQSILDQTLDDFELLINDNASSDRSEQICRDLAASDSRIDYQRNAENVGAAGNYRRVFSRARGSYFRWMNADDLCAPNSHAMCLQALEANSDAVLSYGRTTIIGPDNETLEHYDDNLDLPQDDAAERFSACLSRIGLMNVIYGLIRTRDLGCTDLMGDGSFPAADINLVAELTLYGKFVEIPDRLFMRRMHPGASSWDRSDDQAQLSFWTGAAGQAYRFPHWKRSLTRLGAVRRAPVSTDEKKRLTQLVLRGMLWNRRKLAADVLQEIARPFRSKSKGGST
jgi:glycosyltransferase involved in cell wall biosynthesis